MISRSKIIEEFKTYQESFSKDLVWLNIKLYHGKKVSLKNVGLQYTNKSSAKAITKLFQKNYDKNRLNLELLNLYITYLNACCNIFNALKRSNELEDSYIVISASKYGNLESLKEILINNFFACVNENHYKK